MDWLWGTEAMSGLVPQARAPCQADVQLLGPGCCASVSAPVLFEDTPSARQTSQTLRPAALRKLSVCHPPREQAANQRPALTTRPRGRRSRVPSTVLEADDENEVFGPRADFLFLKTPKGVGWERPVFLLVTHFLP